MPAKDTQFYAHVIAWDTANNVGKTGLSGGSTLLTYYAADGGSATATTNNASEVDATNFPGLYRVQITAGENSGASMVVGGRSTTSNVTVTPVTWSNESNVVQLNADADPVTAMASFYENAITMSAVNDGSATTTSFVTDLTEATDDHYNNAVIVFTTGSLKGQSKQVTDYDGGTFTITCGAFTEAPADNDEFFIIGLVV